MTNQVSKRSAQWSNDIKLLRKHQQAFWEFVAVVVQIQESESYLEQYTTFEEFMDCECGWAKSTGYQMINACKIRDTVSAIADTDAGNLTESHCRELAKVPEKQRAKVFAVASETASTNNRKPTAKDIKAAAAIHVKPKPAVPVVINIEADDCSEEYEDVEPQAAKPEPPKTKPVPTKNEQAASLRSIIKQHNAAMMRAVGDLHAIKPDAKMNHLLLGYFRSIDQVIGDWK